MKPLILLSFIVIFISCGDKVKYENPISTCAEGEQEIPESDSAIVMFPNAFTPNGDGLNDHLSPIGLYLTEPQLIVFDQNNQIVYQGSDTSDILKLVFTPASLKAQYDTYYYSFKAKTLAGNVVKKCGKVYAFDCFPKELDVNKFVFGDQLNLYMPEAYLQTAENFIPCP